MERLCDDLFTDTKYSTAIKKYLQDLPDIRSKVPDIDTEYHTAVCLPAYDVTESNLCIIEPLTLLYASWIPKDLQ